MTMLNPKELRIGNMLLYNGVVDRITCIDLDLDDEGVPLVSFGDSNPVELNYGKVAPIPITRSILDLLGFEERFHGAYFAHKNYDNEFEIAQYDTGYRFSVNQNEHEIGNVFYYVHRLQNLFFAITGKELNY